MNLLKKENFILLIIKYAPLLFIFLLVIIGISFITSQHNSNLQKEQTNIQKEYLELHKNLTKINIQTVNRYIQTTIDDSEKYLQKE
jgi:flagellar basal body-associated protein FliL